LGEYGAKDTGMIMGKVTWRRRKTHKRESNRGNSGRKLQKYCAFIKIYVSANAVMVTYKNG
jgi:hypothetical protein